MSLKLKKGFTLIELLIVIAIIAILVVLTIWAVTANLAKSRDARRKSDLERIKIAFEDYYGDSNEYPPESSLADCGSDALKPYLSSIPCDPRTKRPYCYIYDSDNNAQNYRILSNLENRNDPVISELSCDEDPTYCGYEDVCSTWGSRFNYGVSSANVIVNNENVGSGTIGSTPSPTPPVDPLPSTIPGFFACSPPGQGSTEAVCNSYSASNITQYNCPVTWSDSNCSNYCPTSPSNTWCDQ